MLVLLKTIMKNLFFFFFAYMLVMLEASAQSFTKVDVQTFGKVYITQGDSNSVRTDDKGSTSIKNGTLIIDGKWDAEYHVTMKTVERLAVSGTGSIQADKTISSDKLKLDVSGAGKMELPLRVTDLDINIGGAGKLILSGTAQNTDVDISGSGKVEGLDLVTQNCKANVSGVGKCDIDVVESMTRNVSGMGSINYKTKPKKLIDINMEEGNSGEGKYNDKSDTTKWKLGDSDFYIVKKDSTRKAKKEKQSRVKPIWQGIELGLNNYFNADAKLEAPAGYDFLALNTGKSVSVSVNLLQKNIRIARNFWFFTGLGVTWNNYRFDNNVLLTSKSDFISGGMDTSSTRDYIKSKLTTSYLMAPVMFELFTSGKYKKAFHIGAGGMFGYRLGSHTKQKYIEDGKTNKPKVYDDFNLNALRYGVRVAVGYGKFNLFGDYYYSNLFRQNKGPVLQPVNIGITVVPF